MKYNKRLIAMILLVVLLIPPIQANAQGLNSRPSKWSTIPSEYRVSEAEAKSKYPQGAYILSNKAHHFIINEEDSKREKQKMAQGLKYNPALIDTYVITGQAAHMPGTKDTDMTNYRIKKGQNLNFHWTHEIPWGNSGAQETLLSFRDEEIREWTRGVPNEGQDHTLVNNGQDVINKVEQHGFGKEKNKRTKIDRIVSQSSSPDYAGKRGGHRYTVEMHLTGSQVSGAEQLSPDVKEILRDWFSLYDTNTGYIDKDDLASKKGYKDFQARLVKELAVGVPSTRPWDTKQLESLANYLLRDKRRYEGTVRSVEYFTPAVLQYHSFTELLKAPKEKPLNCSDWNTGTPGELGHWTVCRQKQDTKEFAYTGTKTTYDGAPEVINKQACEPEDNAGFFWYQDESAHQPKGRDHFPKDANARQHYKYHNEGWKDKGYNKSVFYESRNVLGGKHDPANRFSGLPITTKNWEARGGGASPDTNGKVGRGQFVDQYFYDTTADDFYKSARGQIDSVYIDTSATSGNNHVESKRARTNITRYCAEQYELLTQDGYTDYRTYWYNIRGYCECVDYHKYEYEESYSYACGKDKDGKTEYCTGYETKVTTDSSDPYMVGDYWYTGQVIEKDRNGYSYVNSDSQREEISYI